MGQLDGKIAIITGGTSGIGRRSVERFVEEGARVVFAGRRAELGAEIEGRLGANAVFHRTDVSVEAEVKALVDFTVARFGRIDCLFNNAGGPAPTGGIEGIPLDAAEAAMRTLFMSVVAGMKHVAPVMRAQGSGSIINNASVAATRAGYSSSVIYSAAKAAVIQVSKCVAMELGEDNIRVNTISPGAIATGIFGKALGLGQDDAEKTAAIIEKAFVGRQPIQRAGLPEDIANAAVFFASDTSSFVNGQDLIVDGGLTTGRLWTQQQEGLKALQAQFGALPD